MSPPVLHAVLGAVTAHRSERPVALFDLDGTLYDNRPRTLRILYAFAAQLPKEHSRVAEAIRALSRSDLRYRLEDTLKPLGVSTELIEQAKAIWRVRFFSDASCADDVPVPGSVSYVRRCWEAGATVVYLTGRDIPGMLLGTARTLRDDGFPIGVPRVELVMKPSFEEDDTAFKNRLLHELQDLGKIVASFDNEPANCNMIFARWPECYSVLLDTQRAPGAPELDKGCHSVPSFEL